MRIVVRFGGETDRVQQVLALLTDFLNNLLFVCFIVRAFLCQQLAGQRYVLEGGVLGEQVKGLENQAEMQPLPAQFSAADGSGCLSVKNHFIVYPDYAAVRCFQEVQTAQQCGFTAAG